MTRIHHSAICTQDMEESLRFWRDGLGFVVQMNEHFGGDWPTLFAASTDQLHSIFLGDPDDLAGGIVELVEFAGMPDGAVPAAVPQPGFFLLSIFTDLEATLARLAELQLGGVPRRIEVTGGVQMAVVRDPNGVLVEIIDPGAADNLERMSAAT